MTKDEQGNDIAAAVREYSDNKGRIACLGRRLQVWSDALEALRNEPENQANQDAALALERDPREDVKNFLRLREKQDELRNLFRDLNLDIA